MKLLLSFLIFSFPVPAFAQGEQQELLIRATVKLIRDVQELKRRVEKLERENEKLRMRLDTLARRGKELTPKEDLTLIVGTFRKLPAAQTFAQKFEERTGLKAQVKETVCRKFSPCYVVFTLGSREVLSRIHAQGYRDAFISNKKQAHD